MQSSFSLALDRLARSSGEPQSYGDTMVGLFPVTGVAVSTLGDLLGSETLSATDARAARLDELQFDLGEGPSWDALRGGTPVAESAMTACGYRRWPVFGVAARDEGVQAMFAFPLMVGSLKLGSVHMYSAAPAMLDERQAREASAMADVIARNVLRQALKSVDDAVTSAPLRSRRVVHQATGVVIAQLGISPEDAELVIQGRAFAGGRSMMDVAEEIVAGVGRFHRVEGRIEVQT